MNNVNRLMLNRLSTCIMDSQRRIISLKIFVNMCAYVKKESHIHLGWH